MNANTEILQIVNLALMINDLDGSQVVFNGGGSTEIFCVFVYPKDGVAPEHYMPVDFSDPQAHPKLRLVRHHMETLLAFEEECLRIREMAA